MTIVERIHRDIKTSSEKMAKLHKQIKDDFKFSQGSQWSADDVQTLDDAGVKALTINKLKPIIKLITGIERQSRSDFKAFPEGGEDELTSDIVSRLLKNVSKNSKVEVKESEVFKNGVTGGMCFIEPYMDYSYDLINGDLKFKKISPIDVYLDPDFQEYDLSDAKYVIKVTKDLTRDDLENLFPNDKSKIDKLSSGSIESIYTSQIESHRQLEDYPKLSSGSQIGIKKDEISYDLVDYYYKEHQNKYFAVVQERGIIKQFDIEDEANEFLSQIGDGVVIDRKVPVVMHAQLVGDTEFYNDVCWCYPNWKDYPIIPFFAELITEDLDDFSLKIQGIVRGIKDLQEEYNKRRTQELRHLNSSANSGFDIEEGQLDPAQESKLKKYGSSPGIVIKRKKGTNPISRITPMPLSQGHSQLAEENAQDLKEASGVNPDLLANDSQSQSGRAILLKQRQGLVMVQEMLDNFGETKKLIGRFILSQIPEIFTVETALRVVGDAFISENFTVPTSVVLDRAIGKVAEGKENELTELENSVLLQYPQQQQGQPIVDETNQLVTMVDFDSAIQLINKLLTNNELNKYDVSIGEGPYQETIKLANFMDLKDLATQGVPIPPQVLIEASMLSAGEKGKIMKQLAQQAQMQQAQIQTEQQASAQ
jgi:hypothetical protein